MGHHKTSEVCDYTSNGAARGQSLSRFVERGVFCHFLLVGSGADLLGSINITYWILLSSQLPSVVDAAANALGPNGVHHPKECWLGYFIPGPIRSTTFAVQDTDAPTQDLAGHIVVSWLVVWLTCLYFDPHKVFKLKW